MHPPEVPVLALPGVMQDVAIANASSELLSPLSKTPIPVLFQTDIFDAAGNDAYGPQIPQASGTNNCVIYCPIPIEWCRARDKILRDKGGNTIVTQSELEREYRTILYRRGDSSTVFLILSPLSLRYLLTIGRDKT